ncbi:hypothetical protein UCMB321_1390 [Pseudomonas batumici]|uniref:Uncharacterized protein n=1 Tax=Pseudomonas batumici TaxID=226910 RepID=A0A0C2IJJ7_9PSED|nr:hypothetical protein UCMB321_1390 [Pseudomonas batumici]
MGHVRPLTLPDSEKTHSDVGFFTPVKKLNPLNDAASMRSCIDSA